LNFSAGLGKEMGEGGVVAPPLRVAVLGVVLDIERAIGVEAKKEDVTIKLELNCRLSCSTVGVNLRVVEIIYQSRRIRTIRE
jgi:hypothetical protein